MKKLTNNQRLYRIVLYLLSSLYLLGYFPGNLSEGDTLEVIIPVLVMLGIEELNHLVVTWNSIWLSALISASVFGLFNLLFMLIK